MPFSSHQATAHSISNDLGNRKYLFGWNTLVLLSFSKDRMRLCAKYRGIDPLGVVARTFAQHVPNHFGPSRHACTRSNRKRFRSGDGCIDQIFTFRVTLEHRYKFQRSIIACLIGFYSAFYSVDFEGLWEVLLADGIPFKLVCAIKLCYSGIKAYICACGDGSCLFELRSGIQRCLLSLVLSVKLYKVQFMVAMVSRSSQTVILRTWNL